MRSKKSPQIVVGKPTINTKKDRRENGKIIKKATSDTVKNLLSKDGVAGGSQFTPEALLAMTQVLAQAGLTVSSPDGKPMSNKLPSAISTQTGIAIPSKNAKKSPKTKKPQLPDANYVVGSYNQDLDGIELRFTRDGKEAIVPEGLRGKGKLLSVNRFWFSRSNSDPRYWNKNSPESLQFANDFCEVFNQASGDSVAVDQAFAE